METRFSSELTGRFELVDRLLSRGVVVDWMYRFQISGVHLVSPSNSVVVASLERQDLLSGPERLPETLMTAIPRWLLVGEADGADWPPA